MRYSLPVKTYNEIDIHVSNSNNKSLHYNVTRTITLML